LFFFFWFRRAPIHDHTNAPTTQNTQQLPAALLRDTLFRDAPELALRDASTATNAALHRSPIDDSLSGTTAVVALLRGATLYLSNVGDSRAVAGVARPPPPDGFGGVAAVPLSWDHTPFRKDEYDRVRRAGARVLTLDQVEGLKDASAPCWRTEDDDAADPPRLWLPDALYPGTAFTRSLGDAAAERIGVIADPEVRRRVISPHDRFVILATDGVWEFVNNQEGVDLVAALVRDPQRAAVELIVRAYSRWLANETRTDDITAAVIVFDGAPTPASAKASLAKMSGTAQSIAAASAACARAAGVGGDLGSRTSAEMPTS
jgi:serine/threonine protein phosphatase PrpC